MTRGSSAIGSAELLQHSPYHRQDWKTLPPPRRGQGSDNAARFLIIDAMSSPQREEVRLGAKQPADSAAVPRTGPSIREGKLPDVPLMMSNMLALPGHELTIAGAARKPSDELPSTAAYAGPSKNRQRGPLMISAREYEGAVSETRPIATADAVLRKCMPGSETGCAAPASARARGI